MENLKPQILIIMALLIHFEIVHCDHLQSPLISALKPQTDEQTNNSSLHEKSLDYPCMKGTRRNYPLSVIYVEVNNVNFTNLEYYKLSTGEMFFDIGIIFAANINYNVTSKRAYFSYNENVATVLSNAELYIQPLQQRGTKVMLSILGNHGGAGFCNFPDRQSAFLFAQEVATTVLRYDLDGVDFDDEYAKYGINGTGAPNAFSFLYLLQELRALLPDKIISLYYYGPASDRLQFGDLIAGDYLDYSWNAIYSTYYPPDVPGLGVRDLGPAAVNVNSTSTRIAKSFAHCTLKDKYGVYLMYGLPNVGIGAYLNSISEILYGVKMTAVTEGPLHSWSLAKEGNGTTTQNKVQWGHKHPSDREKKLPCACCFEYY